MVDLKGEVSEEFWKKYHFIMSMGSFLPIKINGDFILEFTENFVKDINKTKLQKRLELIKDDLKEN